MKEQEDQLEEEQRKKMNEKEKNAMKQLEEQKLLDLQRQRDLLKEREREEEKRRILELKNKIEDKYDDRIRKLQKDAEKIKKVVLNEEIESMDSISGLALLQSGLIGSNSDISERRRNDGIRNSQDSNTNNDNLDTYVDDNDDVIDLELDSNEIEKELINSKKKDNEKQQQILKEIERLKRN
ncbi:MAG: hypothetical protein EZS28_025636 [Streblomastix strix]|uniref:Uncharacterized protein n=1 Tax=Streblomastix strix TaxID=222440 RepID=A0A5J4V8K8_9EUKA|nr:MAG: hypothetical protein EZS28_025636 [Streblomastix strix]